MDHAMDAEGVYASLVSGSTEKSAVGVRVFTAYTVYAPAEF